MFSSMCCWKSPATTKYQPNEKKEGEDDDQQQKCCKHCPMRPENDENDITVWPQEKVVIMQSLTLSRRRSQISIFLH